MPSQGSNPCFSAIKNRHGLGRVFCFLLYDHGIYAKFHVEDDCTESKHELKAFRKSNGLTQMELANELGVSFSTTNRLENDRFNPNYELLRKFNSLKENIEKADSKIWQRIEPSQPI